MVTKAFKQNFEELETESAQKIVLKIPQYYFSNDTHQNMNDFSMPLFIFFIFIYFFGDIGEGYKYIRRYPFEITNSCSLLLIHIY